jgi:integrase
MAKKKKPCIYERGRKWVVDTTYRGQRIWETCATSEMAETALRTAMTRIDEGRYLDKKFRPTLSLDQFSTKYLAWCEKIGQKSVKKKRSLIENLKEYFGAATNLGEIDTNWIEKLKTERTAKEKKNAIAGGTVSINRQLATLKHMYSKAIEWGDVRENPAKTVKLMRERPGRTRYLDVDEIQKLLAACTNRRLKHVVLFALNTGMRKSEIFNLRWDQVRLKEGRIELPDQKNNERGYLPMNQTTKELLSSMVRRMDSPYVFAALPPKNAKDRKERKRPERHQAGDGFAPVDLKKSFAAAVEKAGLKDFTFHDTRHTFASHLVMNGVDIATVKQLLRHKTLAMTARYSHLSQAHLKSAVDTLDEVLKVPILRNIYADKSQTE